MCYGVLRSGIAGHDSTSSRPFQRAAQATVPPQPGAEACEGTAFFARSLVCCFYVGLAHAVAQSPQRGCIIAGMVNSNDRKGRKPAQVLSTKHAFAIAALCVALSSLLSPNRVRQGCVVLCDGDGKRVDSNTRRGLGVSKVKGNGSALETPPTAEFIRSRWPA
jgi:hypothetical protein